MKNQKINVLFLCTGNACRSQMAEGWARHLRGDVIEPFSAGIKPVGVSSRAVEVMTEASVDISAQNSNGVDDFPGIDFDYVVTLCDNAKEHCPVFGPNAKLIHRSFADPYFAEGTEEQIMAVFRETRDQIKDFVKTMPDSLKDSS